MNAMNAFGRAPGLDRSDQSGCDSAAPVCAAYEKVLEKAGKAPLRRGDRELDGDHSDRFPVGRVDGGENCGFVRTREQGPEPRLMFLRRGSEVLFDGKKFRDHRRQNGNVARFGRPDSDSIQFQMTTLRSVHSPEVAHGSAYTRRYP
ncbi:MAG: hypothetical protein A2Z99_18925 [Treponema sp. GWB1_62_6]|nr:MAG: hypothetical protein A2Z99_18925 [Treponema sp. GWB1_62_6]